jgi:hypothetical protein
MCLYPKYIQNKKYTETKKNGGNIPAVTDKRTLLIPVGCGNCMECRKQKAREWQVRLLEDIKHNKMAKFITLTFNNESIKELTATVINDAYTEINKIANKKIKIWSNHDDDGINPLEELRYIERNIDNKEIKKEVDKIKQKITGYDLDNAIATKAVRLFLERWRKKHKKSLRHWLVTELGHAGTENIHLHGIIWTEEENEEIRNKWGYGYAWLGNEVNGKMINYVNAKTVNYITKYVNKIDEKHKTYKSIILTSAGIGRDYTNTYNATTNKYNETETIETYRTTTGHKIALPKYWRNKIYTDEEKERLWLIKLDKEIRYINGEKIDISKDEEEYYKTLEYYRTVNKELGYGTDEKNWKRKIYEEQRRTMLQKKRIE